MYCAPKVSHDTDKLIRQLSLVAFLMAERRPLTARDVKSNVEGYSEMSDEAFARRFYSDRAELLALGVPLQSQRDEFTGEELYTLRSEQYFLPQLDLEDDELAALQTALYLLEGKFAYAEPLRLALQNLALGRPGFAESPTATAGRVEVLDPDYSPGDARPAREARGRDLEAAHRPVRVLVDLAGRDRGAHAEPVRAPLRQRPLVRRRARPRPRRDPDLPGLPDPGRDQVRHAARARLPDPGRLRHRALPRPAALADRRPGRRGADRGARRHRLVGAARLRRHGPPRGRRLRHGVLVAAAPGLLGAAPGRARGAARAELPQARGRGRAARRPRRPRGRAARAGARDAAARRRRHGRPPRRAGRAGAVRGAPGAARIPARRLR